MTYPFNPEITKSDEALSLCKWIEWRLTTTTASDVAEEITDSIDLEPWAQRILVLHWAGDVVRIVRDEPKYGTSLCYGLISATRMAGLYADHTLDHTEVMEEQFDSDIPDHPELTDDDIPYLEVA